MSLPVSSSGQENSQSLHRCPASDVPPEGSLPAAPGEFHLAFSQHLAGSVSVLCPFLSASSLLPLVKVPLPRWPRAHQSLAPSGLLLVRIGGPGLGGGARRRPGERQDTEEGGQAGGWTGLNSFKGSESQKTGSQSSEDLSALFFVAVVRKGKVWKCSAFSPLHGALGRH